MTQRKGLSDLFDAMQFVDKEEVELSGARYWQHHWHFMDQVELL
jgi:hypothetical protein